MDNERQFYRRRKHHVLLHAIPFVFGSVLFAWPGYYALFSENFTFWTDNPRALRPGSIEANIVVWSTILAGTVLTAVTAVWIVWNLFLVETVRRGADGITVRRSALGMSVARSVQLAIIDSITAVALEPRESTCFGLFDPTLKYFGDHVAKIQFGDKSINVGIELTQQQAAEVTDWLRLVNGGSTSCEIPLPEDRIVTNCYGVISATVGKYV